MIERTCIVCKHKHHQQDLTRLVCVNDQIQIQTNKKLNGRGAYLCKNNECVEKLIQTRALNRAFKCNISIEEYKKVLNILEN